VPGDLAAVVMRSLAKKPKERFRNAADFAAALRNPSSVHPLPPPVPDRPAEATAVLTGLAPAGGILVESTGQVAPPRRKGISPWWTLVPILLLLGLIAWAFWQGLEDDDDGTPSDNTTPRSSRTTSQATSETVDESIELTEQDCRGSIDQVTRRLERMDLAVLPDEQDNPGDEKEGEVIGCSPIGDVQPGELITVSHWGPKPEETPSEPTETPTTETTAPTETASEPAAAGDDELDSDVLDNDVVGNDRAQGRARGNEG
jgi:serine/threonine-protein kinase